MFVTGVGLLLEINIKPNKNNESVFLEGSVIVGCGLITFIVAFYGACGSIWQDKKTLLGVNIKILNFFSSVNFNILGLHVCVWFGCLVQGSKKYVLNLFSVETCKVIKPKV